MIGYIRIYKPELKFREFTIYNSYYCGICKALGDRYGLVYRNFINYDAVFVAILLDCARGCEPGYETFRCILHPFKKKPRCIKSETTDFAADLTVFLTQAKLKDNILDDNDLLSKGGERLLRKGFLKAKENLDGLADIITGFLDGLSSLENNDSENIDDVSDCYGNIIKEILEDGAADTEISKELGWIGYHLGKWVYLADAFTDLEEDIKKGRYNPFAKRYGYKGEDPLVFRDSIKDKAGFLLMTSLDEMAATFEEIDKRINSGIIRNIIYEGLFDLTDKILNEHRRENAPEKSI